MAAQRPVRPAVTPLAEEPAEHDAGPIRVAYLVSPSADFAGIERVVHQIASALAVDHPLTLDVHVIFASAYDESVLHDTAYTRHVLGVAQLRDLPIALRRCVAEHDFDVLVTPQVEASVLAWTATRGLRLPVVVPHLHGNPRVEKRDGTVRSRAAFALFERLVAPRVPLVLAVSPSLRDYVATHVAPRTRVVFVPNPVRAIDTDGPQPTDDGRFRFLSVARLTHQKGQDVLLRALALARPDLPPTVLLTLVGNGDGEDALRALSVELGIGDLVEFAGYCSDPTPYLLAADCFVFASRWEGFGVALVEALQCGLPVIATDCEFGPADVVTGADIGELVPVADADALAAALVRATTRTESVGAADRRRAAAADYAPGRAAAAHFSVLRAVAPVP